MEKRVALVGGHGVWDTVAGVHGDARGATGGIARTSVRTHAVPDPLERAHAPVDPHQVVREVAARK
eukprot:6829482-Alexandrium_andersonii.AAC.1